MSAGFHPLEIIEVRRETDDAVTFFVWRSPRHLGKPSASRRGNT